MRFWWLTQLQHERLWAVSQRGGELCPHTAHGVLPPGAMPRPFSCGSGHGFAEPSRLENTFNIIKTVLQPDLLGPVTTPCPSVQRPHFPYTALWMGTPPLPRDPFGTVVPGPAERGQQAGKPAPFVSIGSFILLDRKTRACKSAQSHPSPLQPHLPVTFFCSLSLTSLLASHLLVPGQARCRITSA